MQPNISGKSEKPAVKPAKGGRPTAKEKLVLAAEVESLTLPDFMLTILTVLAVFYTLYFTRALLFPIVLSFTLNLVLKPTLLMLNRLGIPNALGAMIIMVLGTGGIVVLGTVLWTPANSWINEAQQRLPMAMAKLEDFRAPLEELKNISDEVENITKVEGDENAVKVEEVKQPKLGSVLSVTGSFVGGAMIISVLLFFLLAGGDRFLEKLVVLMPSWRDKRRVVELTRAVQNKISSYLFSITAINIGLGIVIGTGMHLVGLPEAALWGVMATLLNFIPFVGAVLGAAVVFAVALISLPTLGAATVAPIVYLGASLIEGNFITPAVLGRSISLNPVIIILAIFFWGWLWGIGGVLLAVPILLILKITFDHSTTLRPLGVFLEN